MSQARIPYVYPPQGESEVADRIRARRPDGKLIALDGVLLNAPAIANGYSKFIGAIRNNTSLDDGLRELIILRIAALNKAEYEWKEHERLGIKAGLTPDKLKAIKDISNALLPYSPSASPPPLFNPLEVAILSYTDSSTLNIKVPKRTFEALRTALREHISSQISGGAREKEPPEDSDEKMKQVEKMIMEVTATIAGYNTVSRILVALDVDGLGGYESEGGS
ncbi:hypothetical protein SISNIDRAFT_457003 [Sistotremastrum niveocremeum HHB9708]|uniref:Carboxymuconolactone decarboxylase-like domain-containing protein n=1 Tax=Sistotremastrum niveocremeum HHB9708 TaxID=1314777 RepID=A0A164S025_9AGAM|nr:hypothetical protein SISNIDRAFT_457003 [Sistotremastrum niveocremeum HHB9708]